MKKVLTSLFCVILLSSCSFIEDDQWQKDIDIFMEEFDNLNVENNDNLDIPTIELVYSDEANITNGEMLSDYLYKKVDNYFSDKIEDISYTFIKNFSSVDASNFTMEVYVNIKEKVWFRKYFVVGKYIGWEIQIISSIEQLDRKRGNITKEVRKGNFHAYIERIDEEKRLYLKNIDTWEEELIDELLDDHSWFFEELVLMDDTFLVYTRSWWEYHSTTIVNLYTNQYLEYYGSISDYRITPDKKYIYICSPGGMHEWIFSIYKYPDLELMQDIQATFESNGWWTPECISQYIWGDYRMSKSYYSEEEWKLYISTWSWVEDNKSNQMYIYDFNTSFIEPHVTSTCDSESILGFTSDISIFWRECWRWYYSNPVEAYYYTILKDIDAAYNIKHKPDMSREDFRKLYRDIEDIYVANYKTEKPNSDDWNEKHEIYTADILVKTKWEPGFDVYNVSWYIYFQSIHTTSTRKKSEKIYPINK